MGRRLLWISLKYGRITAKPQRMLPLGWLGTSFDVLAMEETGQIFLCLGPSCSLSDTRERRGPAMWSSPALPPSMPFLCLFLTPLLSGVLAFHFPSSSSSFWLEPFLGSSIAPVLEQVSHLSSIRVRGCMEQALLFGTSPDASQTSFLSWFAGWGKASRGGVGQPGGVSA